MPKTNAVEGGAAVSPSLGLRAAKVGTTVGMQASTYDGAERPGGVRGEPADTGARQRNTIDRAFLNSDALCETSAMPRPGSVSP